MKKKLQTNHSDFRMWFLVWGLGLTGQICWNMESQWANVFVYSKIGKNPSIITGMLILGSVATTFSTFFFGTLGDRTGKRRRIIAVGYMLWGVFITLFGFIGVLKGMSFVLISIIVVLNYAIIGFFGSMATDAGFNAWTNDVMTDKNRGQIGGSIVTQCVLGTVIASVAGGLIIGSNENYSKLYFTVGIAIFLFGILTLFLMNKGDDIAPSVRGTFAQQFFSIFDFKKLFSYKELILVNISISVFFIGFNMYYAYLGNYLVYYLGFSPDKIGIIEGIPLVLSMLAAVPVSILINKNKHIILSLLSIVLNILGLLIIIPIKPESVNTSVVFNPNLLLPVFLIGVSYISILQVAKVWTKQLFPKNSKGQFEGIWMIFFALIPNIGGSLLGEAVVKTSGETFLDEVSGQMNYIPNGNIFFVGAIIVALSAIPFFMTIKHFKKRIAEEKKEA